MQIVNAQLKNISRVHSEWRFGKAVTTFNAEIGGVMKYSISVPPEITLSDGMVVIFALAKMNNWQTVVGMRENSSPRIFFVSVLRECIFLPFSLFVFWILLQQSTGLTSMELTFLVILLVLDIFCLNSIARVLRAWRLLDPNRGGV